MKKRILFVCCTLLMLLSNILNAQTAIYKAYVDKPNISASCLSNYPIGDNTTVAVTMLQADDSATFKNLMKSLVALPYHNDKSGKRNNSNKEFKKQLEHLSSNTNDINNQDIKKTVEHISKLDMTITPKAACNKRSFTTFRADPLPGDKGLYEIFHSSGTLTILVFHCPDYETAVQVTSYMIENIAQSLKKK